ncbi:hypothetical protein [Pseudomonas rubra]|uniref:Uncharacterized protein n=1 Tax=Pseudomonas rubra TaxID=2942627 RepID=A0ABT5PA50_9PSED|nr:hypothetical protein [Pseudomonas rubra]MDD1014839.1 hypothetical protein [Pseudomonas rubra]MDD1040629.1 hypothetical protein [Pseudomonas rubra]MDD1156903.1 hypothetical protein [Pseudomonas rubra]
MDAPLTDHEYEVLHDFVSAIACRDSQTLRQRYEISPAVIEEIYESLDDYFPDAPSLTISARNQAQQQARGGRPFIDNFQTNEANTGIECILFANGCPSEAILHAELTTNDSTTRLHFKYIA